MDKTGDLYIDCFSSASNCILYNIWLYKWLAIPWVPIALIGTAVAFIVGFKNKQTYNRFWEARQIWGSIVNSSRAWGIMANDFVNADKTIHRQLMHRHCAWLTALRYQLRKIQPWENINKPAFKEYRANYIIPEWQNKLEDELKKYLSEEELTYIINKKNRAT